MFEFIGLFLFTAGFVIGLGSVTVLDLHGFLARKSPYWTEATIRSHKITKPLIWIGTLLVIVGATIFYSENTFSWVTAAHIVIFPILILNGSFLSFYISPQLLKREKEGRSGELLPFKTQSRILISFIISFVSWWISFGFFIWYILNHV